MNQLTKIAALVLVLGLVAAPAPAQSEEGAEGETAATTTAAAPPAQAYIVLGAAFAAGMIIIGAAYGIGKIGSSAVESMARQPEVAGNINTAMIIAAALIEGVTFFALIVCLLNLFVK